MKMLALPAALAVGLGIFAAVPARADVPTAAVCKSFANHAIRWNTRARQARCTLPRQGANFHFDEQAIYRWCMGRPNDDRSPQALGHKAPLERHCGRRL